MRPHFIASLNLASVSFAAAVLLISCGPAIGDTDQGGSTEVTAGSSTSGNSNTTVSGGSGSTTTQGGAGNGNETMTTLPPPLTGSGGSGSNPNDCTGVTTYGNSCSPNVGWCNYAQAEIGNNCAGCHGSFRYLANVKADSSVEGKITGKSMPPSGGGLPSADISKLKTWIDCGYPK